MSAKFVLGIDLGTTNSVVAYASLEHDEPLIEVLPIPQLVDTGTIEIRQSLPSFTYLADSNQAGSGGLDLEWESGRSFAVGEMARRQAADYPQRTVSAAKSWLCYSKVDRRSAILPWNAPEEIEKISPVTASQRYLEHLAAAWAEGFSDAPISDQEVVLTVPASFDAVARELTREAALAAGFPADLVLLEEPQAAVYWWLAARGDRWRKELRVDDRLLVCDVGGGTTDLTLIGVSEQAGELALQRLAVGNHLLVGGDNMDLALAHMAAERFAKEGVKLDPWQSVSLWHACRNAKEILMGTDPPETHTISILGRGSKLIGGTVSIEVNRDEVAKFLTEGFFPECGVDDRPRRQRASGFQQIGLPFESDTSITKHIAAFLGTHAESEGDSKVPAHMLFNGGAFKAGSLRQRLLDVVNSWSSQETAPLEGAADLDHAVARGATYYAWVKKHGGVRIRGGVARSYYVGIETAGLAIPGAPRPLHALCVVPFGMEEGTEQDVASEEIGLVHGEPAEFRFFSSQIRKEDSPGDVLERWEDGELEETTPLKATLPSDDEVEEQFVPVQFQSKITELGMFELWCVSTQSDARWKLEFSVRDEDD